VAASVDGAVARSRVAARRRAARPRPVHARAATISCASIPRA